MIFVSYSHQDETWRKRFETIAKPLSKEIGIIFWSDQDIAAGKWEEQIKKAMGDAAAAVLLVSDQFLASDYIMENEVPYLLDAHHKRGLMIFWAYLEPCDLKRVPQITQFQAMKVGQLRPMSSMTDWEWKTVMVHGCGMIDDCFKKMETPDIDPGAKNRRLSQCTKDFVLLSRPARKRVEVLVYSPDKKWWKQPAINPGSRSATIYVGDANTKSGTGFKVVALTTAKPLADRHYLNIPEHRTKSEEITLFRA
jgi:hypothetical protein